MNERDKRVVETMARCGISLEGLIASFQKFPVDEVSKVYHDFHGTGSDYMADVSMKMNCS